MGKLSKINIVIMIISIAVVAGLGSLFVNLGTNWFNILTKPTEWISNVLIPIVWTVIYLITAVILFFWIKKEGSLDKKFTILFVINGILNILWCLLFFTFGQMFIGLVIILLNLLFAIKLIFQLSKYNLVYSYILGIYPLWLSIATALNLAVWILN